MALQCMGTRAFAVRCDACGRCGPVVLAWRANDSESHQSAVLEAIDGALAIGFSVTVDTEDKDVKVTRCLCQRCVGKELPS